MLKITSFRLEDATTDGAMMGAKVHSPNIVAHDRQGTKAGQQLAGLSAEQLNDHLTRNTSLNIQSNLNLDLRGIGPVKSGWQQDRPCEQHPARRRRSIAEGAAEVETTGERHETFLPPFDPPNPPLCRGVLLPKMVCLKCMRNYNQQCAHAYGRV